MGELSILMQDVLAGSAQYEKSLPTFAKVYNFHDLPLRMEIAEIAHYPSMSVKIYRIAWLYVPKTFTVAIYNYKSEKFK
jgi:hypothetical protein